jgi:hypothetical protein
MTVILLFSFQRKIAMRDHGKSLEIIRQSGALNLKMSLDEVLAVSSRLSVLNEGDLAAWTFISPNYVYTGDAIEKVVDQVATKF